MISNLKQDKCPFAKKENAKEQEESFYNQIGGEEMTKKLVPIFLIKVRNDERINFFFNVMDTDSLIMTFMGFISICLGGTDKWFGRSIKEIHKSFNIQLNHFKIMGEHFHDTLLQANISKKLIEQIINQCFLTRM